MDEHEAEAARDAADHQRKHEREHPSTEVETYEEAGYASDPASIEAREAAEHFDEKVEEAKEQGAASEEIVQEHTHGFYITLTFKIPRSASEHHTAWDLARNIADEILGEAVQIDDSWDHNVEVQEWRR